MLLLAASLPTAAVAHPGSGCPAWRCCRTSARCG